MVMLFLPSSFYLNYSPFAFSVPPRSGTLIYYFPEPDIDIRLNYHAV